MAEAVLVVGRRQRVADGDQRRNRGRAIQKRVDERGQKRSVRLHDARDPFIRVDIGQKQRAAGEHAHEVLQLEPVHSVSAGHEASGFTQAHLQRLRVERLYGPLGACRRIVVHAAPRLLPRCPNRLLQCLCHASPHAATSFDADFNGTGRRRSRRGVSPAALKNVLFLSTTTPVESLIFRRYAGAHLDTSKRRF